MNGYDVDLAPLLDGWMTRQNVEAMWRQVRTAASGRHVGDAITVRLPDRTVAIYEVVDHDGGVRPLS